MNYETRRIQVTLIDNGMDGSYQTARHAVTVAIRHHEAALKGIDRNKGTTRATTRARATHLDALEHLRALMTELVHARTLEIGNQHKEATNDG